MRDILNFQRPNEAYVIRIDVQRNSIYGKTTDYEGKDK